ncbi:MmyB family transcriptional regulator [Microlunatus parietis]|uniref:MmyB-like transcription regulator ligand binding domain-containing protein n=1 Tax=Microlunatus parietis TaxID=682979 RepID=A0A7Y9LB89_9ACTN|nr:transcriptional regulator [Microlunatus parietis]NYE70573.1 hypothetical protein [Microlunatus parietis]
MADHRDALRPTVRAVLTRLEPTPALVINQIGDVIAWNNGGRLLFGPSGLLDGSPPNTNRYIFADPRARETFPDWELAAEIALRQLRRSTCPHTEEFVASLSAEAPEFGERFAAFTADGQPFGEIPFQHPAAGTLRLAYELLDLSIVEQQFLVVCLPADDHTRRAFDRLSAGTGC